MNVVVYLIVSTIYLLKKENIPHKVDCPKSGPGPGPGGPRSGPDRTPNVWVQVQLVSRLDLVQTQTEPCRE